MRASVLTRPHPDAFAPEAFAGEALMTMAAGGEPDPPLTIAQINRLVRMGFLARRDDSVVLTRKGEDFAEDCAAEQHFIEARGGRA